MEKILITDNLTGETTELEVETQEEVHEVLQVPTLEERLEATEQALLALLGV